MKRFVVTSLLALVLLASSSKQAEAHHWNHNYGIGFTFGIGLSLNFGIHCGPQDCCPTQPVYPVLPPPSMGMDFGGMPHHPSMGYVDPAQLQSGYYFPGQYGQAPAYWYGH